MNKNVFVFGGAGYIGSHACKRLYEKGYNPITFDNLTTGHKENVKWGDLIWADISDPFKVRREFGHFSPMAVMHFAAKSIVPNSFRDPHTYWKTNFEGFRNILNSAYLENCRNVIFSSTAATYRPTFEKISEVHSQEPISPYGSSKLACEMLLRDVSGQFGMKSTIFRYFNVAGADPQSEIGENHDPETHLIPNIIKAAIHGKSVKVFGDDYPTADGTCYRDYVHVVDLVDAHIAAMERNQGVPDGCEIYNLGNSQPYSVLDVIRMTEKVCGVKIDIEFEEERPGDPPVLFCDSSLAREVLKWNPKYDLENMIEHALLWHAKDGAVS